MQKIQMDFNNGHGNLRIFATQKIILIHAGNRIYFSDHRPCD